MALLQWLDKILRWHCEREGQGGGVEFGDGGAFYFSYAVLFLLLLEHNIVVTIGSKYYSLKGEGFGNTK